MDLMPGGSIFAEAALKNRIGYLGVAYSNSTHVRLMEDRLLDIN